MAIPFAASPIPKLTNLGRDAPQVTRIAAENARRKLTSGRELDSRQSDAALRAVATNPGSGYQAGGLRNLIVCFAANGRARSMGHTYDTGHDGEARDSRHTAAQTGCADTTARQQFSDTDVEESTRQQREEE